MVVVCSSALFSTEKFKLFFEIEGERQARKIRDKLGSFVAHRRIGGKYADVLIFNDVHCENRVIPAAEARKMNVNESTRLLKKRKEFIYKWP